MSHQIKGFFKRITGEQSSYDALTKQPITDAEYKLKLFNDATSITIVALENYLKSVSKLIDQTLSEKFSESKDQFAKYDKPSDQVLGTVLEKMSYVQAQMNRDMTDFIGNVESNVLKPLMSYQEELKLVKDNKKELKDAYDKIEVSRQNLDRYRKADSDSRSGAQAFRASSSVEKRNNDRLEDKLVRCEKDLDEAKSVANEKYDKYTEILYKRISEECELGKCYANFLNAQRKYHKHALKKLDMLIPEVDKAIYSYYKKPVFGSDLEEYVERSRRPGSLEDVSPVIKWLIQSMYAQNVLEEEGIFRIAGSRVKMNCLLNAINCGYLDYLDTHDFDVHCLAGVLKQYIRELPDSLLCDKFYEDWIKAIGSTPIANKMEAYKQVLDRIPKVNKENICYLIKFLAKIVENSDKTKMTTANMGICFGVSLLSSSSPMGSSKNKTENSIDMATATNVFDFLLNNHKELFTEEIDFNISNRNFRSKKINYNTLPKVSGISKDNFCKVSDSPFRLNNTDDNISEDSISELQNSSGLYLSSPFHRDTTPSVNSAISSIALNNNNNNNMNRTLNKKSNIESEFSASNNSINSLGSMSNFNSNNKSLSSPSQNSNAEPGSLSPRRDRDRKKMAPAPPPPLMRDPGFLDQGSSYQANVIEIQTSPPQIPMSTPVLNTHLSASSSSNNKNNTAAVQQTSDHSSDVSKQASLFPKLPSNQSVTSTLNALRISNEEPQQQSPSISPNNTNKQLQIEKPSQPPPSLPNRPPPIGFNITNEPTNEPKELDQQKIVNTSNSNLLSSSSSSASSSSQEMLNSVNSNHQQGLVIPGLNSSNVPVITVCKGPKPAVPRRPGNMISAHINKFDQNIEGIAEVSNSPVKSTSSPVKNKISSEITSL